MSNALRNSWPLLKDKLQQLHPELTEEDLLLEPGEEEALYDRLQRRLNKSREEVNDIIDRLATTNMRGGL